MAKKKKARLGPEKIIENQILDWLNLIEGCFAFKVNNVGIYDTKKKVHRKNHNSHVHNGISDILFCYKGRFGSIEVKAGYNKPTENQLTWLKNIDNHGGVSWWTNDLTQCKKIFAGLFPNFQYTEPPLFEEIL